MYVCSLLYSYTREFNVGDTRFTDLSTSIN